MPTEFWLIAIPVVIALCLGAYAMAPTIVTNLVVIVSKEAFRWFLGAAAPKDYTPEEKASLRRGDESQGKPGQRPKGKDGSR